MKGRVAFVILVLAAAGGAMALRLPELPLRPMHCDEAVHAYKLGEMIEGGHHRYRYDPLEYHGPTMNYAAFAVARLRGITRYAQLDEFILRIVPVAFGVGLVLLLWGLDDGLGYPAAVCAAVLTALSACMVFYSRYFIMEVPLVFFTFLAIAGAWRYVRSGSAAWCAVAGAGVGLMHATKETWVFVPVAMGFGLLVNLAWRRWVEGERPRRAGRVVNWRVALAAGVAAAVAGVLLSSFLTNPAGAWDSILTYVHGLRRAGGGGGAEAGNLHVNPWDFYLRRLVYYRVGRGPIWTEALIVGLALAGTVAGFARRGLGRADAGLVRVLGVYSFALLGIYSVVPYKTPWCVLGALHGMILVAGVGAVALVRWVPTRPAKVIVALLLAAGAGQLGWQAVRGSFKQYDRPDNPWVYAQTLRDTVRLGRRADELAALHPDGYDMRINFISPDPHDQWPLPWYLRRFNRSRVGYWTEVPKDPDAPMLIFVPEVWEALEPRLKQKYEWEHRGLRPEIVLVVGTEMGLWKKYIEQIRAKMKAPARPPRPGGD